MYIDGFMASVKDGDRQAFTDYANRVDAMFLDYGATRVVDGWGNDVPHGKLTDFYRAVAAEDGETVVFGWMEWPDKATRDTGFAKAMADDRMQGPMPFDGKRMVFGGFVPIVNADAGDGAGATGYIDGFVTPVTHANRDAYVALEEKMATKFLAAGARRFSEHWADDVPDGKVTDFKRSVLTTHDEVAVFAWAEWPDRAVRDAGWATLMADPDMQPGQTDMPFDGKRVIYGGFEAVSIQER